MTACKFASDLLETLEEKGFTAKVNCKCELPGVIEILVNGGEFVLQLKSSPVQVKLSRIVIGNKSYSRENGKIIEEVVR